MPAKKIDLCLHAGGSRVTFAEVAAAPTPPATKSWHPIPHLALITHVLGAFEKAGLNVVQEVHSLAHNGDRYFGMIQLEEAQTEALAPSDRSLIVGLRNSHDKRFPAGLVVGDGVFVCDNLCFSGEIRIGRKHTRWIERDLPRLVAAAVGKLGAARKLQDDRAGHYKVTQLEDPRVNDLLVRALDARVISSSKIGKVLDQWREPNHPEFAETRSYWRLHNAFTEVLKGTNPFVLPGVTQRLNGLLDADSGLILGPKPIIDVEAVAAA